MKDALTIRRAEPEDYQAVSALEELEFRVHRQARPDYFHAAEESYSRKEYEEQLGLACPIAWLAQLDENVVGLCFGKIDETPDNPVCKTRKVAFIQDLATLPEYRGRGIATALMARAREQAVAEKADSLELCVWNFNENALKLYERMGMKVQYYRLEERL